MFLSTLLRKGNDSYTVYGKLILEEPINIALTKHNVSMNNWLINSVLQDGFAVFYGALPPTQTICAYGPPDLK